jgi:tetratricopeptide (TPR) repeat protein
LDRLVEESRKPVDGDPLSGHIIRRLWEKGRNGSAEEIHLAAMCVLAMDEDEVEAFEAVRVALNKNMPEPQNGAVAQSAALGSARRKDLALFDRATTELITRYPGSLIAQNRRIDSLMASGKWAQALETVESAIVRSPDEENLPSRKLFILNRLGRSSEFESMMVDRISRGKASPGDYNNLAWWHVVARKIDAKTLEYARRAILGTGATSSAAHHTLATVLAESNRTAEALEFLLKAVGLRDDDDPTGADWFLMGRIAEQLGEIAASESYYRRVKPDAGGMDEEDGSSCLSLAKRHLESLGQRTKH